MKKLNKSPLNNITQEQRKQMQDRAAETRKSIKSDKRLKMLVDKELSNLTEVHKEKILKKLKNIPVSYRLRYVTAMKGKSRRTAINVFCSECMGYSRDECYCQTCPLYLYK